ncbi:Histidinol-phosphate aminotransferase [Aquisphaera giovannonii]|uniref:Histidinol-phosphate aminotransferase n=1 Tax=Aquisphaera giovannonii TaxID=406548 RepID=A0A5B9WA82_9BACT|nr:histidinol-phosphate transaminase [Aquisphaera giovannonii]QEH37453.1 Histidinol-phosphate aminotransferase [Aquisphaera giovannonii]
MNAPFQPHILDLAGYVPGEQPQGGGFVKLNTNENPYPPSPRVIAALGEAINERLRLYPDPLATEFCRTAAALHGVSPDMVMAGNGSDDVLTVLTRAFVGPGELAAYPSPSYLLYSTLIRLQNGTEHVVPFSAGWKLRAEDIVRPGLKLVYLANPNSPSGTALSRQEVADLAAAIPCPFIVDEAYADFADDHAIPLVRDFPNVIVCRTFSKGYSLAGIRLGYLIARPEVVEQLVKVKDSYNCDALSLAAGTAALKDREYHDQVRDRVIATRTRLTEALRGMGYTVPDSQANFVWATDGPPAEPTFARLKERRILVRLMKYPGLQPGLRISIGTDAEIDRLLEVMREPG